MKVTCPDCELCFEVATANEVYVQDPDKAQDAPPATGNIGELIAKALNSSNLTEWESAFLNDLNGRYRKYFEDTRMSDKQMSALRRIAAK